jgi:hypothetical protein
VFSCVCLHIVLSTHLANQWGSCKGLQCCEGSLGFVVDGMRDPCTLLKSYGGGGLAQKQPNTLAA